MIEKILSALEVEIESSDKYIREYDSSTVQKAYNKGMRQCLKIVQEVAKDGGWIPCSDRLPKADKNRKYLVCGKNGGIYIAEFVCKSVTNVSIGPWWSASGRYAPEPIAWQPLPAPYQKGE